jgi:DNA-binding GntR family transcriptional regulator
LAVANNLTKSEKAYTHIRSLLKNDKICVDKLTEKKIIELTGFSRSPVRDSLLRLEAEGVVRFNGHRRGRVIEYIEEQPIEEVLFRYELREYVQSGASFLAAKHFNGWQIERLQELVDKLEGPDEKRSDGVGQDYFVTMTDFYDYLIGNCGNPYFFKIWQKYRLMPLEVLNESTREKIKKGKQEYDSEEPSLHDLVDAIASHEAELAEQIAKKRVQLISSVLRRELYS